MPRDLADVLHHLLPEAGPPPELPAAAPEPRGAGSRVVAIPVGDDDAVRAAFVWNLAIEVARAGGEATVVAPESDRERGLWPAPETRPLGVEIVWVRAADLAELDLAARTVSARLPAGDEPGLVLVRVPPTWLLGAECGGALLDWALLLSSSEPRDLLETYALAKAVRQRAPAARLGVTLHGTHRRGEAQSAFSKLADVMGRRLGASPRSYGLVVDDVQVFRAALEGRPVGLVHPQGRAARSLGDVARLLLGDAREAARA